MKIFFTSDTHFGHRNIIRYCDRPFDNVEEMNTEMIERWNAVVSPDDTVLHLGDFALGSADVISRLLTELNGHKVLVIGNHDRSAKRMRELGFDEVYREYEVDGIRCIHYPEHARDGELTFCGHIHDLWSHLEPPGSSQGTLLINVGVDVRNFEPRPLEAILAPAPYVP